MLQEYQLTNFKAFAGPETIPIKPITLIYGPNSSGKSSILQSLLLLKQTLQEAESTETLLLPQGIFANLGSYREFVHRHDVSQPFSFKVLLKVEQLEPLIPVDSLLAEQLDEIPLLGLRITFAYDEETLNAVFSAVEVFVGNESFPAFVYKPKKGSGTALKLEHINPNHSLWQTWWEKHKNSIKKNLREEVIHSLKQLKEAYPSSVIEKITAKTGRNKLREALHKADAYLEEQQSQIEKEEPEYKKSPSPEYQELSGRLDEIRELKRLWQRFDKHTLEKAVEDFSKVIQYSSFVSHRNFIPIGVEEIDLEEPPLEINYLSKAYGGFGTAEYLWDLTEPVCSLLQSFLGEIIYLGSLRDYPQRLYIFGNNSSQEVGKSGKLVPELLYKNPELLKRVNQQLDKFDLGYEIQVTKFVEQETLESSGIFALRLIDKNTNVKVSIMDVGFGISQVLPIIVQSMFSHKQTIFIEQPEVHIHPRLQTELGSLLAECIKPPFENQFIIETHSEHLMLRIQKLIEKKELTKEQVSVIYVDRDSHGSNCLELRLDKDGSFLDTWPDGFFDEDFKEIFS
jgi:predicted ATPase